MRCVVILWALTHAHVKQESQETETPALVSRLNLIENVCLFFNKLATTAIQHSLFVLFFPPSRGLSRGGKNERKERDPC